MTEKSLSLYALSAELKPLEDALEAAGGDMGVLSPELVERVTELLTASQEKIDNYGRYAKHLEATAEAIDDEIKRLQERKGVFQNRLKRLKMAADEAMKVRGIAKVEGILTTISRQRNGGKPPMKILVEPERLPMKYRLIKVEANTEKLREDAMSGDEEALQYVEIQETGYSVRIR